MTKKNQGAEEENINTLPKKQEVIIIKKKVALKGILTFMSYYNVNEHD